MDNKQQDSQVIVALDFSDQNTVMEFIDRIEPGSYSNRYGF